MFKVQTKCQTRTSFEPNLKLSIPSANPTRPYPNAQTTPFLKNHPALIRRNTKPKNHHSVHSTLLYSLPFPSLQSLRFRYKCPSQSSSPTKKTTTTTTTKMRSQPQQISAPRNNAEPNRTRILRTWSSSTTRPRRNRVPYPRPRIRPLSPLQTPISYSSNALQAHPITKLGFPIPITTNSPVSSTTFQFSA